MMPGAPEASSATVARGGVTASRVVAADVLGDLRNGDLLDASFDRRARTLDARDRRWTQELVFGLLRRRSWLDAVLEARVHGGLARLDPALVDLLRLGTQQLLCMGSVPAYAAIAQTVELVKQRCGPGAGKLANAILRRLDRERETVSALDLSPVTAETAEADASDAALAERFSHPRWLVARWLARWGPVETARLLEANNHEAPVVLRPFGIVREQLEEMLARSGVAVTDAPLLADSLQLTGPIALTGLGAFRQGLFFVQDPAATLVARYAAPPTDAVVVDLCAAPGGKTLELSQRVAQVIAADRSVARLTRLSENIRRLDARNVSLLVMDARCPAFGRAGVVIVDAPCTGTGTFRRHPDARWRLRVSDLAVMADQQRTLLSSAATLVAPGGLLVYSTCSLEPEENDEQVERFLGRHPSFRLAPPPDGAVPAAVLDGGCLRVFPQRHGADGAFAARFRRAS